MKYEDWFSEEVLKVLLDEGIGSHTQNGPGSGPVTSIYGNKIDKLTYRPAESEEEEDEDLLLGKKLEEDDEEKAPVSAKADGGETVAFTIPKLVPTEAWGDPSSSSRQEAYNFFKKFPGSDLKTKITKINGIADRSTNVRSVAKVLSTLVFFDSLSSVVKDFTAASAGFVFEGFLAALLNGTQEIERSAGGTLDITDLKGFMSKDGKGGLEGGYPISLKLLTGGGTDIKGSYANLVGTMAEGKDKSLLYVVVAKDKSEKADILSFHEFDIDPANFHDILNQNNNNKALGTLHKDILQDKRFQRILKQGGIDKTKLKAGPDGYLDTENSYVIITNDISPALVNNTKEFFELMRYTRGYYQKHGSGIRHAKKQGEEDEGQEESLSPLMESLKKGPLGILLEAEGGTQFKISQPQMKSLSSHRYIGTLDVSPERMKGIMERYAAQLQGTLSDTYENLKDLTGNINEYFLSERTSRRNSYAKKAIDSADAQAEYADNMKDEVSGKKTSGTE